MGKLINIITGLHLLVSSLPGSASRMHVKSLGKPRDSTSVLKALPGKLDISASLLIQQAFSKPCLVNLIPKDTHLVFSFYQVLGISSLGPANVDAMLQHG